MAEAPAKPPSPDAGGIHLTPFTLGHLWLLRRWLQSDHVASWWGEPEEPLAVAARLPEGYNHAIIALGNRPVGYLRWAKKSKETLIAVGLGDLPDGTYDIDILMGEIDCLGKGYGSDALSLLVKRFEASPPMPCLGLVTSIDNERAIRSYEKVGFVKDRRFSDTTFGECWVMLYPRSKSEGADGS